MKPAPWSRLLITAALAVAAVPAVAEPGPCERSGSGARALVVEDHTIPSDTPEIGLYLRNKRPADMRLFPAERVLLFVHGGPGMPEYFLTQRYPTGLEDHFTVVWWEQRGAGLSYHPGLPPETMTAEQFVLDTLAVTDYLRQHIRTVPDQLVLTVSSVFRKSS